MWRRRGARVSAALAVLLVAVACGDDGDEQEATPRAGAETAEDSRPVQNACPVEGCRIEILDAARASDELRITWEANFDPNVSRNHIHVYWDTYDPNQVSDNAESVHGVTQGEWVPTDDYPVFVTEGAVSVSERRGSETVCVTAGDRDHNVLDVSVENCRDVAALL